MEIQRPTPGRIVLYNRASQLEDQNPIAFLPMPAIVMAVHDDGSTCDLFLTGESAGQGLEADRKEWAKGKVGRFRGGVPYADGQESATESRWWTWPPRS